jgi:hypothetical protein
MGPASLVAQSGMPAIALADPQGMTGKLGSFGVDGPDEPGNIGSLRLEYRSPAAYVSIDVSRPGHLSVMSGVSPTEARRLGLPPEPMPLQELCWRSSDREVLVDGVPVPGLEAVRHGGWEFRGQLDDGMRLQIIAIGIDRDLMVLRRAHAASFVPDYWRA